MPPLEHPDASVGAAVEYACEHLGVPNIIVCGHYGCGGVKAALGGVSTLPSSLREWLEPVQAMTTQLPRDGLDEDALWRLAVEENVLVQLDHLLSFPEVVHLIEQERVELHGWVYDLGTAQLAVYDHQSQRFQPASELLAERT